MGWGHILGHLPHCGLDGGGGAGGRRGMGGWGEDAMSQGIGKAGFLCGRVELSSCAGMVHIYNGP